MSETETRTASYAAAKYADLSEKLSLEQHGERDASNSGTAVEAKFITPLDPVIETADGNRLPGVPVVEAHTLNALKAKAENSPERAAKETKASKNPAKKTHDPAAQDDNLDLAIPPLRTHPLFPPLPLYGPPRLLRNIHCLIFRFTSFWLSTGFLLVIVLGAVFTSIPRLTRKLLYHLTFRDPNKRRPFYAEERKRAAQRQEEEQAWIQRERQSRRSATSKSRPVDRRSSEPSPAPRSRYEPLEGGPDKVLCDARYYARRVGLEMETFKVQTEDGFILDLWHLYDPSEQNPSPSAEKQQKGPNIFNHPAHDTPRHSQQSKRYPVLLIHGLLQSAGAYCVNDSHSLAFYLHKSGYDVWLGNNRCGFTPEHTLLSYSDPRMWAWNIRQMGVMDLPAFISRVLHETHFPKVALVAHSQGTTETFVALAKEQRPDIGAKISVFCALAPAVFAGPLIGKMYFKFMRLISPAMFRMFFGIHAFIPLMMTMHSILPARLYGTMGYLVFWFLFNWSDERWDRGLRDRFFQFAPVYVSAESMRWWLGRECFAKYGCVLSTRESDHVPILSGGNQDNNNDDEETRRTAWYDNQVPPFALWVAGSDDLVDGRKLLRRFEMGREPFVDVVHSKVIDEYEHLDVLWAVDAIDKVGSEVRDVIWRTIGEDERKICRRIEGVEDEKEYTV